MNSKKKALLAASIAGLMTVTVSAVATNAQAADGAPCYGVNACKGTGDCGGKGSSCHGSNACKGQGWIEMSPGLCTRIEGGKLKAE